MGPPAPLVGVLSETAASVAHRTAELGDAVLLDPLAVLTERAAISGLRRRGRTSCGGATRLLRASDGWLAVSLARPDDLGLLPAWLGVDERTDLDDAFGSVATAVSSRRSAEVADGGAELGLPVARVGSVTRHDGRPVDPTRLGNAPPRRMDGLLVLDLSSLWAGPLCTRILADAGADVIKVESTKRPDGARNGPGRFFDLMNAGKRSVALDFASADGRAALARLVAAADVVVEGSRPRALEALGIDARAVVASGPSVWLSITGYGRHGAGRGRVAFGDDAAAAGGALVWDGTGPWFCGDAIADPVTGLTGAAVVAHLAEQGGRWLVDLGLSRIAASMAPRDDDVVVATRPTADRPRARACAGDAVPLGRDTEAVLAELGIAS
jgi:hypothetical protein